MTAPEYARLAGRVLTRFEGEPDPVSRDDRTRAIAAIEGALRAKRRRGRFVTRAVAAAAIAATVGAVGIGVHAMRSHEPAPLAAATTPWPAVTRIEMASAPAAAPVRVIDAEGAALAPGSRIVAKPRGHAILAFATGTRLVVEDGGDVTLVDDGPRSIVAVAHGALRADVSKLREGEAFVVRTSDAEIDVRGTSLRIAADASPCGGAATRVQVEEGSALVRHGGEESRVEAGESWPRGCVSAAPVAAARAPSSHAASASASTLAEQNDLFASAVAAKQAGSTSTALERFEAFARRYPTSPLAENAAAERMRLLRGVDLPRAQTAARAYLARWPEGFARSEAEGVLSSSR